MMPTLTITKGLPASGKSTWAKEQVAKSQGKIKRVNKDDLRGMLDAGEWSREREKTTIKIERDIARRLLSEGFDVIVDNTHLGGDHEAYYSELAELAGYNYHVEDFTHVPLQTCIDRDSARPNSVGQKVIKRMYNSYIKGKTNVAQYVKPPYNPDLPTCIIVDIDGTLAHVDGRSFYDYSLVSTDIVDENVAEIVRRYANSRSIMDELPDTYVVIVSGRESGCRAETEEWLHRNQIPYDEFYMRDHGDMRNDAIVKKEIYEQWIKHRYNVRFVLDDRDRVVKMWREQGLKVLQVAYGDF